MSNKNLSKRTLRTTPADLVAELAEINEIKGTAKACAGVLTDNYMLRYESVCETDEEIRQMVLEHFLNLANEVVKHVKIGNIGATHDRARALDILRFALFGMDELAQTEEAIGKLVKLADAMYSWTGALERM